MGLYSVGEEAYLRNISKFCLFTRVRGMSENMEGAKKLYIRVSRRRYCGWRCKEILDFSLKNDIH